MLDVAERLFLADGFEATSMDRLAAEASVSKRTIYNRFNDKAELFIATLQRAAANQLASIEVPLAGSTAKARLENLALLLIDGSLDEYANAWLRVVISAPAKFITVVQSFETHGHTQAHALVEAALSYETKAKTLRLRWPLAVCAEHFLNITTLGFARRAIFGIDLDKLRKEAKSQVRDAVATFLAGCTRN